MFIDIDGFKICIQVCIWMGFPPLMAKTAFRLFLVEISTWKSFKYCCTISFWKDYYRSCSSDGHVFTSICNSAYRGVYPSIHLGEGCASQHTLGQRRCVYPCMHLGRGVSPGDICTGGVCLGVSAQGAVCAGVSAGWAGGGGSVWPSGIAFWYDLLVSPSGVAFSCGLLLWPSGMLPTLRWPLMQLVLILMECILVLNDLLPVVKYFEKLMIAKM